MQFNHAVLQSVQTSQHFDMIYKENKEKDNTTDHEEICGNYTGTAIFPKTNADKQWLTGWTYPVKMH